MTELRCDPIELRLAERASLLTPGVDGIEAHRDDRLRAVNGLGFTEDVVPVREGTGEARRERVGDVVISGYGQHGGLEAPELFCSSLEL